MRRLRSGRPLAAETESATRLTPESGEAALSPAPQPRPHSWRIPDRPRTPPPKRKCARRALVQQPLRCSPRKKNRGRYQPNTPSRPKRLMRACQAVAEGMSVRVAAHTYNVRRSTLSDECQNKHPKARGRPTALTATEELVLVDHLLVQADWGFPLSRADVSVLVKEYLDKSDKRVTQFKDNLPGWRWVKMFLERHRRLNFLIPKHIKTSRSKVDPDTVTKYFENLQESTKDVPPQNIVNYDETSVADTPTEKKLIVRRGEKYPVKCVTTSKSAMSVMFAGTAAGHMFPPYVVYRSKELTESWTTGGPPGTRYNRSKSGWFDKIIFEDWFLTIILPWARNTDGKKVLIGDNVSSHFSAKVIELCAKHNISFVCLPPNSTHLLQPLDVAFFSPLKTAWKRILLEWKDQDSNRHLTLPKPHFPCLLRRLVDEISERSEQNLKSGFRATGIFPLDKNEALKRFPGYLGSPGRQEIYKRVSDSFIEKLQEKRYGNQNARRGGKRLRVSPGKSWAPEDLPGVSDEEKEEESDPDDPGENTQATPKRSMQPRRRGRVQLHRSDSPDNNGVPGNFEAKPGDWVLVKFAKKRKVSHSIGYVNCIDENYELSCKFLRPSDKPGHFIWPHEPVTKSVDYSDVEKVLSVPKKLKRKGTPLRFEESFEGFNI
ncbi:Jerky protein homolog-like, partial [Frankliniella fusca]